MIKGIDLSTWNENVDYNELKRQGIEFAIIRSGYGKDSSQKDDMFEEHYKGCKEAGIKVGAYLYSYCTATENAEKEAYNCLSQIAGKDFDLPIFYDLEEQQILDNCDPTTIANIFCNVIKNAGYKAGVYANLNWFNNYLNADEIRNNGNYIWLAQWNNEITADFPVDIWQNTNNLDNMGIDGNVLINESLIDNTPEPTPTIDVNIYNSLAVDVIFGKYGNGQERKNALGEYYEETQNIVNEIYNIIEGE